MHCVMLYSLLVSEYISLIDDDDFEELPQDDVSFDVQEVIANSLKDADVSR